MKKNGFTLIELLAVIVILAIIALIATPAVLNIIEDSKKGAAEASARNIVNAAKTYYMQGAMNGNTIGNIDLGSEKLKYDGDQATKGYVEFTDGKASSKMYINGYCVEVAVDGTVTSSKVSEEECSTTLENVVYTKYNDGTPFYYDPEKNIVCSEQEVETNVNNYKSTHNADYYNTPTITGLKEGCMKWYAILDSEESSTVKLLLDHNTTGGVKWNANQGRTPDTVNAQLALDVANWNKKIKNTAKIISAKEINTIAPTAEGFVWSQSNTSTRYYLHTGLDYASGGKYNGEAGTNKYAWLFDNTRECLEYGCNVSDDATMGYWTSSYASGSAWFVSEHGQLSYQTVLYAGYGVRPVITVSKDVFK